VPPVSAATNAYVQADDGFVYKLDAASGTERWRVRVVETPAGPYGFPGSAAVGPGFVFFAGLDGKVYGFAR